MLWQHGPATVRAINDHLSQRRQAEVGYTTTFVDATFGGSALKLVMQALGSRQTSADELAQIRRLLNDIEIQNSGGGLRRGE